MPGRQPEAGRARRGVGQTPTRAARGMLAAGVDLGDNVADKCLTSGFRPMRG